MGPASPTVKPTEVLLVVQLGLRRGHAAHHHLHVRGVVLRLGMDLRWRRDHLVNAVGYELLRSDSERKRCSLRQAQHEVPGTVGIGKLPSNVQYHAFNWGGLVVENDAANDILRNCERI